MYQWPYRDNSSAMNYRMEFKIKKIEVLRRRHKIQAQCYDGKNYDDVVMEKIMRDVGCQLPFYKMMQNFPVCASQNQVKNISIRIMGHYYGSVQTFLPCSEIQQIQLDFHEIDDSLVFDFGAKQDSGYDGWFMFLPYFPYQKYFMAS